MLDIDVIFLWEVTLITNGYHCWRPVPSFKLLLSKFKPNPFITPRKQFLWYTVKAKISSNWIKFCWIKKMFFNVCKTISFDQRKFFWINKTFFDSKKLFFQCSLPVTLSESNLPPNILQRWNKVNFACWLNTTFCVEKAYQEPRLNSI